MTNLFSFDNSSNAKSFKKKSLLVLSLSQHLFGVDIDTVVEIQAWKTPKRLPKTKEYLLGVINYRGTLIPVVDLNLRVGRPAVVYGEHTIILVVRVNTVCGPRLTGVVIDSVEDVVRLPVEPLEEGSLDESTEWSCFASGVCSQAESELMVLELHSILDEELSESPLAGRTF